MESEYVTIDLSYDRPHLFKRGAMYNKESVKKAFEEFASSQHRYVTFPTSNPTLGLDPATIAGKIEDVATNESSAQVTFKLMSTPMGNLLTAMINNQDPFRYGICGEFADSGLQRIVSIGVFEND